MAVANKIYSGGKRVLQKRNSAQQVIFNDADISLDFINSVSHSTVGDFVLTFSTTIPWIISNWRIGGNANFFRLIENSNSVSKILKANQDNNGDGIDNYNSKNNSIFLPQNILSNITSLKISQNTGTALSSFILKLNSNFPNLILFECTISMIADFNFLDAIYQIKALNIYCHSVNYSNLTKLTNSNITYFVLRGYALANSIDIIRNLPYQLYYFECTQLYQLDLDLKDYYSTENRIAFVASTGQSLKSVSYSGGAIFCKNITPKHTAFSYILYLASNGTSNWCLNPDDSARFIVDFANQVESCSVFGLRIRMVKSVPNTAYVDNSKPLYKTYTAALNYITTTLGITVQFT